MNAPYRPIEPNASKASLAVHQPTTGQSQRIVAIGSVIGALAASACCVLPFVLFGLGIGGAWMGNLTAMAPYKPFFVILTAGLIGYGYYLRRRSASGSCESCIRPSSTLTSLAFWVAALLLALALVLPYAAPILLNV